MDKYQETFHTWNKVAKAYQEQFMGIELYNESYDYLLDKINSKNAKILDVGCGPGVISNYLLHKKPDLQISGVDIAPNMIELARKNVPSASFQVLDIRNIDILKDKFDVIVCGFCIPYLSKQECTALIASCNKLLKPGGLLYLSFVEGKEEDSGFITGSSGDRAYFYYHHLDFLRRELDRNVFSDNKVFHVHYQKSNQSKELHTILIVENRIHEPRK